jgi:uncharacterized protein (TIGR03067 family)
MPLPILAALLMLVSAPAADDVMPEDKAKLQGSWTFTRIEQDGETIGAETIADFVLVFEGDKYFLKQGERVAEEGTFALHPEQSPRQIDFKILKGRDAGQRQLGLYKFEGETLRLAAARPGESDRPRSFETEGDDAPWSSSSLKKQSSE